MSNKDKLTNTQEWAKTHETNELTNELGRETNEQLTSELDTTTFYSGLTPEEIGISKHHEFKIVNINPTDKSLELKGKVFQYRNGDYTGGKGPSGLFYCDFGKEDNDNFMIGEFKNGIMLKGFIHYSSPILYETGEFENSLTINLINGKRVRTNGTIEEGEFKNGVLIKGKKTQSDGTIEEGEFKNGVLIKGKKTQSDGTIEDGDFKNALSGGQRTYPSGKIEIVFGD